MQMKAILLLLFAGALLAGCNGLDKLRVYEKNVSIPDYKWEYGFQPHYEVEITDTSARYNIYVTLRHTGAYRFSNIWLLVSTRRPGGAPHTRRVELPLADASGRWLGSGMDDVFEHRVPIQQNARFDTAGIYRFTFEQNMRQNPLSHVMSVGLRIEKAAL
jgi:gliding motility-associated lipoprotein GldH